jgi:hypothetical protein
MLLGGAAIWRADHQPRNREDARFQIPPTLLALANEAIE